MQNTVSVIDNKYEFGKWAELEILKIISNKFNITEMNPTVSKMSAIDAIVFKDNKLYPIQIKTRSPRAIYQDISLPIKQWKNYQDIAKKNGSYTCFVVCDLYNKRYNIDYKLYSFDVSTVKHTLGDFSTHNNKQQVFIKLRDMVEIMELPIKFQRELEKKHIMMIRPNISERNLFYYENKFE